MSQAETREVEQSFQASTAEAGQRLDTLLFKKFPVISRMDWQKKIRDGRVLLANKLVRPSHKVSAGAEIRFSYQQRPEPDVNKEYEILYDDEFCMVISKPPNLPVHPSGVYFQNTLTTLLKLRFPENTPRIAHRLDRETSGCMLLAKSSQHAAFFHKQFVQNKVKKEYLVFVYGEFSEYLDAVGFLKQDTKSEIRKKLRFEKEGPGLTARTEFFPVRVMPTKFKSRLSLLRVKLHTGRMHQIRATLFSIGFPVVGDRLYGLDDSMYLRFIHGEVSDEDRDRLIVNRTALHSARMDFVLPNGEERSVVSDLPADLMVLL